MASVATCPHCGSRVLVPSQANASGRAKCPDCATRFELNAVTPTPIPELIMLDESPSPKSEAPPTEKSAQPPSDTETLESLRSIFAKKDAAVAPKIQLTPSEESPKPVTSKISPGSTSQETKPNGSPRDDVAIAKARHKSESALKSARDTVAEVQEYLDSLHTDKQDSEIDSPSFDLPENLEPPKVKPTRREQAAATQPNPAEKEFDLTDVDLASATDEVPRPLPLPDLGTVEVAPRPRRRRVRRLASVVGLLLVGMIGVGAGYCALLYVGGPSRDYLKLAQHVPSQYLPASFTEWDPLESTCRHASLSIL